MLSLENPYPCKLQSASRSRSSILLDAYEPPCVQALRRGVPSGVPYEALELFGASSRGTGSVMEPLYMQVPSATSLVLAGACLMEAL
eukprot:6324983-Pyramimonas_sp.AAC.2